MRSAPGAPLAADTPFPLNVGLQRRLRRFGLHAARTRPATADIRPERAGRQGGQRSAADHRFGRGAACLELVNVGAA